MNSTMINNEPQVIKYFKMKYLGRCNKYNANILLKIKEQSIKYHLNPELIFGIITLEMLNRGDLMVRLLEICAVYLMPSFIIKKNLSIGLAQIKVKTAKEVIGDLDEKEILRLLIHPLKCIEVTAMLIHKYSIEMRCNNQKKDSHIEISNLYITGKSNPEINSQIKIHILLLDWSIKNNLFNKTLKQALLVR